MCPEPDRTVLIGRLLYRRWGRFHRVNLAGTRLTVAWRFGKEGT